MKTVRMNKGALIGYVSANRERHFTEHAAARAEWVKAQIAKLHETIDRLSNDNTAPNYSVVLSEPPSHVEEYDKALRMLHDSVDDVIELESEQYSQLVLDDWQWSKQFKAVTSTYLQK